MRYLILAALVLVSCGDSDPPFDLNGQITVRSAGIRMLHPVGWGWSILDDEPEEVIFKLESEDAALWIERIPAGADPITSAASLIS